MKNKISNRFAQNRRRELQEMINEFNDPNKYAPILYSLISAQNGDEIIDILSNLKVEIYPQDEVIELTEAEEVENEKNTHPSIHRIFCKGIRCCADFGEFEKCWQIFEMCKNKNIVSNELYNTMMWCYMYENRTKHELDKVFALYQELKQLKLPESPRTYSTLINSCLKARNIAKALYICKNVIKNHPTLLSQSRLCHAIIRTMMISEVNLAIQFIESMEQKSNDPNFWSNFEYLPIDQILHALARKVKVPGFSSNYIEKAEEIFKKCLSSATKSNIAIPCPIFNGIILAYANDGDYDSCTHILQLMLSNKKNSIIPQPSRATYKCVLKSFTHLNDNEKKWKYVDQILKLMKKSDINLNHYVYYNLLEICNDDMERAKMYYNEMINLYNLTPNMAILQLMMNVGHHYFENDENKYKIQEGKEFVEWIMSQYDEYNIIPTEQVKNEWKIPILTASAQ